jgi:putative colanic acid biosysnthesis UDP-glucose lipid carrier transferase
MTLLYTWLAQFRLSRYFRLFFVLWDLVILNLAISASAFWYYGDFQRLHVKEIRTICLLSNLVWVVLLLRNDLYRVVRLEPIESILKRTIEKLLLHMFIIAFVVVTLDYQQISRTRMLFFYGTFFCLILVSRVASMQILKAIRAKGFNFKNYVIVGANDKGVRIHNTLSKDLTFGYRFLGFFDTPCTTPWQLPLAGTIQDLSKFVAVQTVDEIYVALQSQETAIIQELIALCDRCMIRIKFLPDFQSYTQSSKVDITFYDNTPVLTLRSEPLEFPVNRLTKKAFDVVFSLAVIVLIFPWLFPILMLLIKLESPGPIFFKQRRTGRDKKQFYCLKFRSMHGNEAAHHSQSHKGDPRVTRLGAFMRKTSIDELPQFFNVLLGDMSVVGPRPHMTNHTEQYAALINHYLVRHFTKPGITGWAQINGYRGETKVLKDMENRVEHDIWYIENWSLYLDLRIIARTVTNIFKGEENAY